MEAEILQELQTIVDRLESVIGCLLAIAAGLGILVGHSFVKD
jgi:hypothetical protein